MTARRECDVAIVGGGPAGIAAAVAAAEAGARVIVLDEGFGLGGQIWRPSGAVKRGRRAARWVERFAKSGAAIVPSASVVDMVVDERGISLRAESRGDSVDVEARRVVLATGARELFLPFPGWTLPNVIGVGAAQALLKAGTNFRGKRVAMAGSGPLMLAVAASLAKAGATLVLVAEQAPPARVRRFALTLWRRPRAAAQAASLRLAFVRTRYRTGTWVTRAEGDGVLRAVTFTDGRTTTTVECDVLCTGFGLVPNIELARLAGCAIERGTVVVDAAQRTTVAGVYAAGEPTGIGGVDLSLVEGAIAGASAADSKLDRPLVRQRRQLIRDALALERAFRPRDELRSLAGADTIVCRCEDVRMGDLDRAWSPRQAKLYTRAGMGPCQGRICGAALECVMGWQADSVRPPILPARVSTCLAD